VRRDLRYEFPLLSHYFGVKPADVDHMTMREIDVYHVAATEIQREVSSG
jgi:hypothetical protein